MWAGSGGAGDSVGDEAIRVGAMAAEALDLDMNRMREFGPRQRGAGPHDPVERFVLGDVPAYRHGLGRHVAMGFERFRGDAGPDYHASGRRIARGDAERKRVVEAFPRGVRARPRPRGATPLLPPG